MADAEARIVWEREYDTYYNLEGWEYRVTEVKARKRK